VTTRTIDLRLAADYEIDKQRSVRFGYRYARLRSNDWAYAGMQAGGLTQLLPSNEQSPNYSVYVVGRILPLPVLLSARLPLDGGGPVVRVKSAVTVKQAVGSPLAGRVRRAHSFIRRVGSASQNG